MKKLNFRQKQSLYGLIFVSPFIVGFILFYLNPLINVLTNAFQSIVVADDGIVTTFIGLSNFDYIFNVDPDFTRVLVSSLLETLINLPFIVIFSLIVAVILNTNFKGQGVARVIFFLPIILGVDLVVTLSQSVDPAALAAASTEASSGLQADALEQMLLNSAIPESISNILITAVNQVFKIISLSGVQILIFIAALQSINPSLYEVAKIEGASAYETFWKVTIPSISPMIFMVIVYTLIDSFARTDITQSIYDAAFVGGNFGVSSAMSLTYLICAMAMLGIITFATRKLVVYNG